MARKKPRRKASRTARKHKAAARKTPRKPKKVARRPKPRGKARSKKAVRKPVAKRKVRRARKQAAPRKPVRTTQAPTREKPILNRIRRLLADEERLTASAHSGHDALRAELAKHTEASPTLTAGDFDAKWQDAYAIGDEAPGGDNPTPDQDRVDDIGRALGIEYQDGEELKGGEEVLERDRHRWEMDPASSDDWPHEKK